MITVLVPTRGRPDAAWEVVKSAERCSTSDSTRIVFVVDEDDPSFRQYHEEREGRYLTISHPAHSGGMVAALNAAALETLEMWPTEKVIGFIGDDHRFRTPHWDQKVLRALENPGLAYGNDGAWGDRLATQVFISSEIINALGWMGLPTCRHLYIDNAWMALGHATDTLRYMPDVLVEHMHPAFGKGEWDDQYKAVNSEERYSSDRRAFEEWVNGPQFREDVARVRHALRGS